MSSLTPVVLRLADGVSITDTACVLRRCTVTATRWRKRYLASGLSGLKDVPRSGQPTKITPEVRKRVLVSFHVDKCGRPASFLVLPL
ncbi:helix-turn-helix domain-containing protein [Oceanospirillum sp.]|uniref:helix-turn-helix domain-containing protein n=1 Tax=Oceanospirillum sp. TaxID=2021254 RepID=UPI003A936AEB